MPPARDTTASTPVALKHRIFRDLCWAHSDYQLAARHYAAAATRLDCEIAAIRAVAMTEVVGQTWNIYSRPLVLFERHYFARLTGNRFTAEHPDISNPHPGGYGPSRRQHDRLKRAAALDEEAALKSASWGMFQIMGANHAAAGFATVGAMVDAILLRASAHLEAFTSFILHNRALLTALRGRNWSAFASGYNGPGYAANDYDGKMARNYAQLTAPHR